MGDVACCLSGGILRVPCFSVLRGQRFWHIHRMEIIETKMDNYSIDDFTAWFEEGRGGGMDAVSDMHCNGSRDNVMS